MSGFQKSVEFYQSKAVEGDRASTHIEVFAIASDQQMLAGDENVKVGRFAFLNDGKVYGKKPASGFNQLVFIHRQNIGTVFYDEEGSLAIPKNRPVSAFVAGEFWARFQSGASIGQKVFASETDGSVLADSAGVTVSGAVETKFIVRTEAAAGELAKISTWGV